MTRRILLSLLLVAAMLLALCPVAVAEEVFRFDEPVTLRVSVFDRGATGQTPVDNNFWTDWIQQNFGDPRNITIEWVVIPRSEEVAKLNMLMASGEAPDICFTYTESVITNFVKQGGVLELTDLLAEWAPGIEEYLGENLLSFGVFEGGQYAIPAKRILMVNTNMFIRSDWLEDMGMEMPTTHDEWYEALIAIRDNNPGGVADVIPFAYSGGVYEVDSLIFSFITDTSERTRATVPMIAWPGFEDFIVYMNKLYNEGLISPDFALDTDSSQRDADASSGRAGGLGSNHDYPIRVSPGILDALRAFDEDATFRPINAFPNVVDGKHYHSQYAPQGIFNFIPAYSAQPEAALMYLEWLCQPEVTFFLQNGVEGVHYEMNEELGIPQGIAVEGEQRFNSMQNLDYTLMTNGIDFNDEALLIASQALTFPGYEELCEEMFLVSATDPLTTVFHFDVVLEEDAKFNTALSDKQREVLAKSIMASPEDCLATFEALRQEYMDIGGQAVMEEKQAVWETMHGE